MRCLPRIVYIFMHLLLFLKDGAYRKIFDGSTRLRVQFTLAFRPLPKCYFHQPSAPRSKILRLNFGEFYDQKTFQAPSEAMERIAAMSTMEILSTIPVDPSAKFSEAQKAAISQLRRANAPSGKSSLDSVINFIADVMNQAEASRGEFTKHEFSSLSISFDL